MKYSTGNVGRVITIRFHDGDPIYKGLEDIAKKEHVARATVWLIGGVKNGGVVVGPSDDRMPPRPMSEHFSDPREIVGIGTIFPDEHGHPSLHLHAAIGKGIAPLVGCPREGLDCWLVSEAIVMEITGTTAQRLKNRESGFSLLEIT